MLFSAKMRGSIYWAIFAAFFLIAGRAMGASVGSAGYTNDFSTQPPAADWGTASRAGFSTEVYGVDSDVNANITASGVSAQTLSSVSDPPPPGTLASWSSPGAYLQTRPTTVRYTALMGKFVNDSGRSATQIVVSYVFTVAAGGPAEDSDKGTRVYYSLTGLTDGGTNLAALDVD